VQAARCEGFDDEAIESALRSSLAKLRTEEVA
jgi:hypothetical protein